MDKAHRRRSDKYYAVAILSAVLVAWLRWEVRPVTVLPGMAGAVLLTFLYVKG